VSSERKVAVPPAPQLYPTEETTSDEGTLVPPAGPHQLPEQPSAAPGI